MAVDVKITVPRGETNINSKNFSKIVDGKTVTFSFKIDKDEDEETKKEAVRTLAKALGIEIEN